MSASILPSALGVMPPIHPTSPSDAAVSKGAVAAAAELAWYRLPTTPHHKAYNDCTHDVHSIPHLYSDHGHCLHARHTCARLHEFERQPCEWPDNSVFCKWDLGYCGTERIIAESKGAAQRASAHSLRGAVTSHPKPHSGPSGHDTKHSKSHAHTQAVAPVSTLAPAPAATSVLVSSSTVSKPSALLASFQPDGVSKSESAAAADPTAAGF